MLIEVGVRLGASPPESVEEFLTLDQIRLHHHFAMRASMRGQKMHEVATLRGFYQAWTGERLS